MTSHADQARDYVAAAIAQADTLDELYARPERVPPHLVGAAHDKLRRAVKIAEVHALLHIGEQLARLNGHRYVCSCGVTCNDPADESIPTPCEVGGFHAWHKAGD